MALATLGSVAIYRGKLVLPYTGIYHAELVLDAATDLSGPQTLTLAGVTWALAYVRAIDFAGERGVLLVGGAAGWRTVIPSKQYGQGGVSAQMILQDAAVACGELAPVIDASVPPVGQAWNRATGPASDVLRLFLGDGWWMDSSGRVQTALRATTAISSAFSALHVNGAAGVYEIATDSPGDWVPGRTFSGPTVSGTLSRVEHEVKGPSLVTRVMVP